MESKPIKRDEAPVVTVTSPLNTKPAKTGRTAEPLNIHGGPCGPSSRSSKQK